MAAPLGQQCGCGRCNKPLTEDKAVEAIALLVNAGPKQEHSIVRLCEACSRVLNTTWVYIRPEIKRNGQ